MLKVLARMSLALVLVTVMVFTSVACSRSQVAKAVNQSSAVVQVFSGLDIPAQLAAAKVKFTEEEAGRITEIANRFRDSYKDFNERFQQGVKDGLNLIQLSPLFLDELARFNDIVNFKFSDPGAQRVLQKLLAVARIGMNVIAALFATGLVKARAVFTEDHGDFYLRTGFALNRLPYDPARLKQLKSEMPDRSTASADRALCEYFKLKYEPQKIALLDTYAQS